MNTYTKGMPQTVPDPSTLPPTPDGAGGRVDRTGEERGGLSPWSSKSDLSPMIFLDLGDNPPLQSTDPTALL